MLKINQIHITIIIISPTTQSTSAKMPMAMSWKKPSFCYFIICCMLVFLFWREFNCLSWLYSIYFITEVSVCKFCWIETIYFLNLSTRSNISSLISYSSSSGYVNYLFYNCRLITLNLFWCYLNLSALLFRNWIMGFRNSPDCFIFSIEPVTKTWQSSSCNFYWIFFNLIS